MTVKMRIKRAFTLLEMMIALVILGLIGSVTAIQVKKLIDNYRFEAEISSLFIALQEAQILSSTYQSDFALDITSDHGVFAYRFTTDEPLSPHLFSQQKFSLAHTAYLKFNGARMSSLHFDIFSGGRIEPRGRLCFSSSKDEEGRRLWLDLQHGVLVKFLPIEPLRSSP
jgi:prepilin-type N-terminal cleavage/methylation domain-containing protein